MVGVRSFPCGVMDVNPGRGSSCQFGQSVCFCVAWDARVGPDLPKVSDSPKGDPAAEDHL